MVVIKVGLVLLLIVLAGLNLWQTWQDVAAVRWPTTKARALLSRVRETPLLGQRGLFGTHRWEIQYSYSVDGRPYKSGVVTPFPVTTQRNAAMMAEKLKSGSVFMVRYNPRNPQQTRLAVDAHAAWLQFGLRVLVYGVGIGYVIVTF